MNTLLLLALIGGVGGLISGSVGLAGGIFLVPAVVALIGPGAIAEAIVVSFFAVLLNSLSATLANRRVRGGDAFRALILGTGWYTGGAAFTALVVAATVGRHPGMASTHLVAALQLLLAVCMLVPRRWIERWHALQTPPKDALAGAVVGGLSTLIGVGGGTYTIFYFLIHGRPIKDCTLSANFVGIFVGLMGIVGHVASTTGSAALPHAIGTGGRMLLIACGAAATPLGVRLQSRAPSGAIRKAVVAVLALSSAYALLGSRP